MSVSAAPASHQKNMRNFYRFHARIYDATRWTFLFGRNAVLHFLKPVAAKENCRLAEVGCGSGHNLALLAGMYPSMQLTGIDISADMLNIAARKMSGKNVTLLEELYGPDTLSGKPADAILISYCLTMINPGWEKTIEQAWSDLPAGGMIVVVDFHNTPSKWFAKWMKINHVRMDGHLLPLLGKRFLTEKVVVKKAWFGLWSYFLFAGRKQGDH